MTRTYYRLWLSLLCALAAYGGPVVFLEDIGRVGYLLGGLGAALLTWLLLEGTISSEPHLHYGLQGVIGAGAGVFSWMTISLVALFEIIPHVARDGMARFDPVWIFGGLSPVMILGAAWWRARTGAVAVWTALLSALFRFSVPLFGLQMAVEALDLPKQYRWLTLFTGVMFLVLDALGVGREERDEKREY